MGLLGKRPATVLQSTYETCEQERDGFEREVKRLQSHVAVLVIDEDVMRRLMLRAIALLQKVSTTHKASPNFKQEIDVLVGEARSAGLIEEKSKEE